MPKSDIKDRIFQSKKSNIMGTNVLFLEAAIFYLSNPMPCLIIPFFNIPLSDNIIFFTNCREVK